MDREPRSELLEAKELITTSVILVYQIQLLAPNTEGSVSTSIKSLCAEIADLLILTAEKIDHIEIKNRQSLCDYMNCSPTIKE
jgi:hypothetical protein